MGLYYGTLLQAYIEGLYYESILWDYIAELYHGIILLNHPHEKGPGDSRGVPGAPYDLRGPRGHAPGPPRGRPWDPRPHLWDPWGRLWHPAGTPRDPKDHENNYISPNLQRQKL